MIKTAVIGASGYIGRHLWKSYRETHPDCVGTSFSNPSPGLTHFDIQNPNLASLQLAESGHQAVFITSAKSNIAYCEKQPNASFAINVAGTLELVRQIGRTSMSVLFLSSDYVFQGASGGYGDAAELNPTTEYGRQKAIVEREIPSLVQDFLILRLSKIYGLRKGDGTLLDDIASSLARRQQVLAAADQIFCPTEVTAFVRAIHAIQKVKARGAMNVCSPECWSRHDIACAIAVAMDADPRLIKKISLHDVTALKGRPLNLTMHCHRLKHETDVEFSSLHDSIQSVSANWTLRNKLTTPV